MCSKHDSRRSKVKAKTLLTKTLTKTPPAEATTSQRPGLAPAPNLSRDCNKADSKKEANAHGESSSKGDSDTEKKSKVLVPCWREIPFKRSFNMEGTENLSDELFLKRHQKYENEEKQIKKWDMQRQRAELERLKLLKQRAQSATAPVLSSKNKTPHSTKSDEMISSLSENGTQLSATPKSNKRPYNKKNKSEHGICYKAPDQVNLEGKPCLWTLHVASIKCYK